MSDPPRRLCFRHCSRNRDSGRVEGSSVGDHADAGGQQEEGNRAGGREVQEVLRDETPAGGGEQSSAGVGPGSYKQLAGGCCPIAAHTLRGGGYMDYTLEGHTAEAFNILNELRLAGHLCDVTLRVRKGDLEEDVKAHKVVLASCSPVFRAMFTAGLRESAMEVVPIEGIHPKVMQRLVEAAYTARLSVGERCVLAVLQAAAMYHMESVVRVCTHFLKEQLDPSNAIGIAALAESLGCNELHQAARHYIYRKFSEVCQHEEFLSLPHCQLVSLISRDELSVRCESEVFNACLTWARHDLPTRHPYMYAVLSAVRCHSLTPSFLQMQLQRCDELRRNSACTRFLWRVFRELTLHQPPAQAPRSRTPAVPQLLYAVGGYLRHSLPIMEAFDTRTSNWLTLPKLPSPMSGLAVSVVGGLLYAIGGRNNGLHGNEDSSALFCYNPVCNEWAELSHMGTARNRVAAAVVDGQIYAMGGSHGVLHHASVDRYDPELDTWTSVSPMSVARVGLGAAVLHRLIYAIGGFDGEQRLASAEVYHPENATWLPLASMSTVRSGAGVVALGEYVFALGGYDGERQLSSMERYDPRASCWEPLAPMLHTRSALAACTYNEHIYALGGYDGQTFLSSMERYDPVADRWEEVATMATGRSGAGLAVTMEPCLSRSETF